MAESPVEFLSEDLDFEFHLADVAADWLVQIAHDYGKKVEFLTIVFCSDGFLLEKNRELLNHDYFTDIITVPLDYPGSSGIAGDLFISVDRVRENALELKVAFIEELQRVMIHGLLHLLGFDDASPEMKTNMRREEDKALSLRRY